MKLLHVVVRNFKGVRAIEFPAEDSSRALRALTVLLGDNGSGKTSVLQAIALTLSLATRRTYDVASFRWHGFLPERLDTLGPTFVELRIAFDEEEIALTSRLFEVWKSSRPPEVLQSQRWAPPSTFREVVLRFEKGRLSSPQGFEAVLQFLGRYYIKGLIETQPELKDEFAKLGDVFWFDQHRNLGSSWNSEGGQESWQAGVEQLREYLVGWWGYHTSQKNGRGGKDYLPLLEKAMATVFPGLSFVGISPRPGITSPKAGDFYFLLDRDERVYDLAEMSSGEQAIFPLAYEFVRLDIRRSVVLIDELELHLHPPEQQRFLAALPRLGPDCQFIITTHSEYLSSAIPNEEQVRLERGVRCL